MQQPPISTLFPYTTLFRSFRIRFFTVTAAPLKAASVALRSPISHLKATLPGRSEEHTSELQSHSELVWRVLLEKKKFVWISTSRGALRGCTRLEREYTPTS